MNLKQIAIAVGVVALAAAAHAQSVPTRSGAATSAATKTYIVQLADAPAATYSGGVSGLAATRPIAGARFNVNAANVRAYVNYLDAQRNMVLAKVAGAPVLHKYNISFNGFAVRLTEAQAKALKTSGTVKTIEVSERRQLLTTHTPDFLKLTDPGGLWSQTDGLARKAKGEDVIIGMIDSGVWPEDPSFGDRVDALGKPLAYSQPGGTQAYPGGIPAKWKGTCVTGEGFTAAMCNNKLIGARFYVDDYDFSNSDPLNGGAPLSSFEYRSPRDGGGHGTHTSSTAGGNGNANAVIDGASVSSNMSGIAPRARLATYKVCWTSSVAANTGCYTADMVKAVDDAVADGVDLLSFSIGGGGPQTTMVDSLETAFLNASSAGVFISAAAGNSGPTNTVDNISPWLTTVAASTHDRNTVGNVTLGAPSGAVFTGPTYQTTGVPSTPLIRSEDAGVVPFANLGSADKTALLRCYNAADRASLGGSASAALDPAKVAGKMLVCIRGGNVLVNKADSAKTAGAVAMIIQNTPTTVDTQLLQPYVVPTVHLAASAYPTVNTYAAGIGASASFGPGVQVPGLVAPQMASFSSRGPDQANLNILKPDISAPGVDIIAGWLDNTLTQSQHDSLVLNGFTPQSNAAAIQGTSMATPHVTGAAALLKQLHPTWSPAAIKSALMTNTNTILLSNGTPDLDRWGYGAGHLNPNPAGDPGLVYDIAPGDYAAFMCGLGLAPPSGFSCASVTPIAPQDLNLASLTAAAVPGNLTLTRTVTNVGPATATYSATPSLPGWNVQVVPASLTLATGASATFTVKLTNISVPLGTWTFGSLVWNDGVHTVRSPLTARAIGFSAPKQIIDTRSSGSGTKVTTIVSAYTGKLALVPTGLVPATVSNGSVVKNAVQCFDFSVLAGAVTARFQLFNADTLGGSATDLDLDVYAGSGGVGNPVGSSSGGTSDELVVLVAPAAGIYSACVTGYKPPVGQAATFKLSSWVIGPAVGAQSLRAAGPSSVYQGGTASVGLAWSVPAGRRYAGALQYFDSSAGLPGTPIGISQVLVDNRP